MPPFLENVIFNGQWRHNYFNTTYFRNQILHVLVKRIIRIMCAKNSKNTFKFVKVVYGKTVGSFSGHGVHT